MNVNVLDNMDMEEAPINILPKKMRKERKDKGQKKPHLMKPHTMKRVTNKEIVDKFEEVNMKVEALKSDVNRFGEYFPQPAAELSAPDKVDYVALDRIPKNIQLLNSRSDSESFRDATGIVLNQQIRLSSGNLTSGGLKFL